MSVRLLRKILNEQETATQQRRPGTEEQQLNSGDESVSPDSSIHSSKNPFDLLNDNDQGNESEIADESSIGNIDVNEPPTGKAIVNTVPSLNHKSKKNKKKKSKEHSFSNTYKADNRVDVMLENLSFGVDGSSRQSGGSHPVKAKPNLNAGGSVVKQCTSSILQVDPKFLSAENELRRIFGSKVVSSFEKSNQTGTSRQIRGGRRGSHNHRRTILVSPSEHWPRWDGSLSMELLETREGYHYFR
ncbi:unnamed protein product [Ilex paraguariensis]|uniref:Uncharacterized protein n=1 Tax=Ilex paraguariensis TaxID=185542 RepID=A0ABC8RF59_9AQUA